MLSASCCCCCFFLPCFSISSHFSSVMHTEDGQDLYICVCVAYSKTIIKHNHSITTNNMQSRVLYCKKSVQKAYKSSRRRQLLILFLQFRECVQSFILLLLYYFIILTRLELCWWKPGSISLNFLLGNLPLKEINSISSWDFVRDEFYLFQTLN